MSFCRELFKQLISIYKVKIGVEVKMQLLKVVNGILTIIHLPVLIPLISLSYHFALLRSLMSLHLFVKLFCF